MDIWDIGLTKLAVLAGTLFLLTIWPAFMNWAHTVNTWYFFVAFLVFAARPYYRVYFK